MADITNTVTGTTNFVTDIIVWFSTLFANIISNIGIVEIVIFLMIVSAIYFWANQHTLEPRKYAKF